MTDCPSPEQLRQWDAGELPAAEAEAWRAHEEGCPSCMKRRLSLRSFGNGAVSGEMTIEVGPQAAAQAAAVAPTLTRGTRLGRYTVLDKLGEGGMGMVFAAYDAELNRRVALKLLSSSSDPEGQARLMREAQAMAKLAHPNVVAIHDVGTFGGKDVAVVMEFVEGTTLRGWRQAQPRSWRETLRVLLAAGEGLAAAHAVGLVHRDFKPDNILVGNDGRVRVADFGIARVQDVVPGSALSEKELGASVGPSVTGSTSGTSGATRPALTRVGAVVGTPAYMAPEQFSGAPANILSDQYSFAVTLYEALTGIRPFGGASIRERIELAQTQKYLPLPAGDATPAWLLRTVKRALAPEPSQRFASMDALLLALRSDPSVRRLRWAAAALGVLVVAGAVGVSVAQRQAEIRACHARATRLGGIWDAAARARIEAAFSRAKIPFAANALRTAVSALQTRADEWTAMSTEACLSARVHHQQSEEVLALRDHCLEQTFDQLRAVSQLFQEATPKTVSRTGQLVDGFAPVRACADVPALLARPRLPATPTERAELSRLSAGAERMQALLNAGDLGGSLRLYTELSPAALALRYPPLLARLEITEGETFIRTNKLDAAHDHFSAALAQALMSSDNESATRAANGLGISALSASDLPRAREWASYALALAQRGVSEHDQAMAQSLRAGVEAHLGHTDQVREADTAAIRLTEQSYGPEALVTLGIRFNALSHANETGDLRGALRGADELLPRMLTLYGEQHPLVVFTRELRVDVAAQLGAYDQAEESYHAVLASHGEGPAEKNPYAETYGTMAVNFARGLVNAGRPDDALNALAFAQRCFGSDADDEDLVGLWAVTAKAQLARGELHLARGALVHAMEVLGHPGHSLTVDDTEVSAAEAQLLIASGEPAAAKARLEGTLGQLVGLHADHGLPQAALQSLLARADLQLGNASAAQPLLASALLTLGSSFGADSPELLPALLTLGRSQLALGKTEEAVHTLEHAWTLSAARPARTDLRAEATWSLGVALGKDAAHAPRVAALRVELAQALARVPAHHPVERKAMEEWLRR